MSQQVLSSDELIADVRRLHEELGRTPRINDIREHGTYSYEAYNNRWDSIRDVLDAAGIPHHSRINAGSGVEEEALVAELRRLGDVFDRTPTTIDVQRYGRYAHSTYYNHFENFGEALERAGFERTERNVIPEDELLREVRELTEKLGRPPTGDEMSEMGAYHAGTYYNRFGSWTAAIEKATG